MMSSRFADANLSLCGCGFLCIYHAGVCAALKEYAPQLTQNRIYGASAGSIAAAGLICNVSISDATCAIMKARSGVLQALNPTFDLLKIVKEGLNRVLPSNSHELCSGRLFISLTRYRDGRNVIVSEFSSKADLIQAILCSCFIPVFCGLEIPEFHGVKYVDGGFSDNQPVYDRHTITISPFSGEADICPIDHASASILGFVYYGSSIRFTNENFYRFCSCFVPPSQEICSKICRQGFTDALRFITKNSITPCYRCLGHRLRLPDFKQRMIYRRASSTANNPNALMRQRKRLNSECEICFSWLDQHLSMELTSALIPEVLCRSLQEEEQITHANLYSRLFDYACSFRLIRIWIRLFSPFVYYAEVVLTIALMLKQWLLSAPKCSLFLLQQLCRFADALLIGVEQSKYVNSTETTSSWKYTKHQNHTMKITHEPSYSINDLDSFESMHDHLMLTELIIIDYYTAMLDSGSCNADSGSTSKLEKRHNQTTHAPNKDGKQQQIESLENDSGISLGLNLNSSSSSYSGPNNVESKQKPSLNCHIVNNN
jgi:hypothetical protein